MKLRLKPFLLFSTFILLVLLIIVAINRKHEEKTAYDSLIEDIISANLSETIGGGIWENSPEEIQTLEECLIKNKLYIEKLNYQKKRKLYFILMFYADIQGGAAYLLYEIFKGDFGLLSSDFSNLDKTVIRDRLGLSDERIDYIFKLNEVFAKEDEK